MRLTFAFVFVSASLLLAAACGGGTSSVGDTTDSGGGGGGGGGGGDGGGGGNDGGGTDGGGTDAATDAGSDDGIWPASATNLAADTPGGGFAPSPPPGSACATGEAHYTLDRKTHVMTSDRCAPGATSTDPYQRIKNTRTLDATQEATIDKAMNGLVVSHSTACGADKPDYYVTVTTPKGATSYYDSFYICNGGGKIYVDNIDDVFAAFQALAPIK